MSVPFANDGSFLAQFLAMQGANASRGDAEKNNKEGLENPAPATSEGHANSDSQQHDSVGGTVLDDTATGESAERGILEKTVEATSSSTTSAVTVDTTTIESDGKDGKKVPIVDDAKKKTILNAFSTKLKKVGAPGSISRHEKCTCELFTPKIACLSCALNNTASASFCSPNLTLLHEISGVLFFPSACSSLRFCACILFACDDQPKEEEIEEGPKRKRNEYLVRDLENLYALFVSLTMLLRQAMMHAAIFCAAHCDKRWLIS
jgi:hypothetical protein